LSRIRIKKKEASLIRGACRKFLWFDEVDDTNQGSREDKKIET
jgi:hypothetical protein